MFRNLLVICLSMLLWSCEQQPDETGQTDQALAELQKFYEKALESAPDDPIAWAKDDFQRFGDWEYRVVTISFVSNSELEEQLNEYGKERWEVFWVRESEVELEVLLKRRAKSYLRLMPFLEIGKAISGDGASD